MKENSNDFPYKAIWGFAFSVYIALIFYYLHSILVLKQEADYILIILTTFLGAIWLIFGFIEGLYVRRAIGSFIPDQFHIQIMGSLLILIIWATLMFVSSQEWVLAFCIIFFLYTLIASLSSQLKTNPTIVKMIEEANADASGSTNNIEPLLDYYQGKFWKYVAIQSTVLAFLAVLLAWNLHDTNFDFQKHFWKSAYPVLILEFILSQGILIYYRLVAYNRL